MLAPPVDLLVVLATIVGIYALLALGLNLHWGETGLVNLAHAAFFAVGAYASAVLTTPAPGFTGRSVGFGFPVVVGLAGGALAAAALGVGVAAITVDLHGDYLAMATLALAEIVRHVLGNEDWLTGGVQGIPDVRDLPVVTTDAMALGVVLAVLAGTYAVLVRVTGGPFGRALHGVREDEAVARALGVDVVVVKLKAFGLGAGVAGLAGALWAHWAGAISPVLAAPSTTFLLWTAVILGGTGSHLGAVVGTVFVLGLYQGVRYLPRSLVPLATDLAYARLVAVGLVMILVLYYRPHGLLGDPKRLRAGEPRGPD